MKLSFTASFLEARGLVKLGMIYGEELDIFSWQRSLASKLAVSERIDLVVDTATYAKRETRPNNFCIPFNFLSFS